VGLFDNFFKPVGDMHKANAEGVQKVLLEELYAGEQAFCVKTLTTGALSGPQTEGKGWIGPIAVALTERRILIVLGGMWSSSTGNYKSLSIDWPGVKAAEFEHILLSGTLNICHDDDQVTSIMTQFEGSELAAIDRQIQKVLNEIQLNIATPPPVASSQRAELIARAEALVKATALPPVLAPSPQASDVTDKLMKLAELHQAGLLTAEEFAQMKRNLLGS
jgi:hypothetical protein